MMTSATAPTSKKRVLMANHLRSQAEVNAPDVNDRPADKGPAGRGRRELLMRQRPGKRRQINTTSTMPPPSAPINNRPRRKA